MKKTIVLAAAVGIALSSLALTGCGKRAMKEDEYTKDGKLIVHFRNLYFDDYAGGDTYLTELENMMNISCELESYSWADWKTQVSGQVMADSVPDVFHADIDSYNFANLYKYWAEEEITKPLPNDLSRWPNLKKMIDNTTNIESLKLNGKLYGIPIAKNTSDYSTSFSPFTYIYRRDWAKAIDERHEGEKDYVPILQENDDYTWDQFVRLVQAFNDELKPLGRYALGDVEWGYPSITNFYKKVPHCFAQDDTGKYVNNYTTDEYIAGLEMSKTFKDNGWYGYPQNTASDGTLNTQYYSNKCGILYENLSYTNYVNLKNALIGTNVDTENFNIDDATAIMKIKAPDGQYVLEGTDNWFSMTFFDYKISQNKMEKILDLYNYLLSEEGTRFAIYGIEGYDYIIKNGKIVLQDAYWPRDKKNPEVLARKDIGPKYLRYMVSLGYDTYNYDPLTDKAAVEYLEAWDSEMRDALADGKLRVLKESSEVMWLTTPEKAKYSGTLRSNALDTVMNYTLGKIAKDDTAEDPYAIYKSKFGGKWDDVLDEINTTLRK